MKNGPPMTLMMMAADISLGAAIVRPMVSAARNTNAPSSMQYGTSALWSLPTRMRPICGTMRPRKLMGPTMAVEMLARMTAMQETMMRVRLTSMPNPRAVLSSSCSRLHMRTASSERTRPTST